MHAKRKFKKRHRPVAGAVPGTIASSPSAETTTVSSIKYSSESFNCSNISSLKQIPDLGPKHVVWLNIEGYQDTEFISAVGDKFGFHRLVLEDVFYSKISRADEFPKCLSLGFPVISLETKELTMLSLLVGTNFVITFRKSEDRHVFAPVLLRLREKMGSIRNLGADYLAYAILDSGVDTFFPVLDRWSEELESAEEALDSDETIVRIRQIRKELSTLGRSMRGLRDAIGSIVRREPEFVATNSIPYFRDCLSHIHEIFEETERLRDLTTEHLNSYDSMLRERNNEAVQTLTVVSTLFIPLSFIAGLYGMNFDPQASTFNMPELSWAYGYPAVITLMVAIALAFLVYFRKKKWV